ncbi:hypothetical protein B0I65_004776 [Clostridium beijerinckii]|nr:hypothetical protein [Clostridium beijerinckii]
MIFDALHISFIRSAFIDPTIVCIFAGCLNIHAVAIAVLVTAYFSAIELIFLFNSGNLSLSKNTPSKNPY